VPGRGPGEGRGRRRARTRHRRPDELHVLKRRGETMALAQGDLELLESDLAKRMLSSTVPARLAYTAKDGTPRVMPIWFHWTGNELVMCTFVPSPKIAAIRERPAVAITIDTDEFRSRCSSAVAHRSPKARARHRSTPPLPAPT